LCKHKRIFETITLNKAELVEICLYLNLLDMIFLFIFESKESIW